MRKLSDEEAELAVMPASSRPVMLKRGQIDGVRFVGPVCFLHISTKLRRRSHMCVNLSTGQGIACMHLEGDPCSWLAALCLDPGPWMTWSGQ